jgi:hypothetical protein
MRNLLHVIISIAMWGLFAYYWRIVLGREIGPSTLRALTILGLTVVAGLLATLAWVSHNKRLARKFAGRRRQTPAASLPVLEQDTIGRAVVQPGLEALRAARVVDITADEHCKTYQVGRVEASR